MGILIALSSLHLAVVHNFLGWRRKHGFLLLNLGLFRALLSHQCMSRITKAVSTV